MFKQKIIWAGLALLVSGCVRPMAGESATQSSLLRSDANSSTSALTTSTAAKLATGSECTSASDCASNYCYPGPASKAYCISRDSNCARPGQDGAFFGESFSFAGNDFTCALGKGLIPANSSHAVANGQICNSATECQSGYCGAGPEQQGYCMARAANCAMPGSWGSSFGQDYAFHGFQYSCVLGQGLVKGLATSTPGSSLRYHPNCLAINVRTYSQEDTPTETDDIQHAMELGACDIYFPEGTYRLRHSLNIPVTAKSIRGFGIFTPSPSHLIQYGTGFNVFNISEASGLTIQGLYFDGAGGQVSESSNSGIFSFQGKDNIKVDGLSVLNNQFHGFRSAPILIQNANHVIVDGNQIDYSAGGIYFGGVTSSRISHNSVQGSNLAMWQSFKIGISLQSQECINSGVSSCRLNQNIEISDNSIGGLGWSQGIMGHSGIDIQVLRNHIEDSVFPISFPMYLPSDTVNNVFVSGNYIANPTPIQYIGASTPTPDWFGIQFTGGIVSGISFFATNIEIANNEIHSPPAGAQSSAAASYGLIYTDGVNIHGNSVYGQYSQTPFFQYTNSNVYLDGQKLR